MKHVLKKIKSIACLVMVGMLLFSVGIPTYATQDTEAPVFDFDSITLSKTSFDNPYESPRVSIKISDASEIEMVSLSYTINGKINAASAILEYNSASGCYEGDIQYDYYDYEADCRIGYYGDYVLAVAYAVDIYGNTTNLYDLNVPAGNFSVVSNGPKDVTAPNIDYENIEVTGSIAEGESGSISVPISDDSVLYNVYARYTHENSGTVSKLITLKKNANGKYEAPLYFEDSEQAPQGRYQLAYIYAVDAYYNEVYLYNTANNHFNEGDNAIFNRVLKNLENLDFVYGTDAGEVESDVKIESISVSNRFYNKGSVEKVTIVFDSKTEINQINIMYYLNETQQFITGMEKTGPNTFIATMPLYLYGDWHLCLLEISDVYGNTIKLNDKRYLTFADGINTDLSDGDCYVGIVDEETGICISNSVMDDTTTLTVEEQELEGDVYYAMMGEDETAISLYEIQVEGSIGEGTAVAFEAPEGMSDGQKVTVVHQKHDGTTETFEVVVEDGLIVIETDEFSPFLIKVNGTWAPPETSGGSGTTTTPGSGSEEESGDSSDEGRENESGNPSDEESEDESGTSSDKEDDDDAVIPPTTGAGEKPGIKSIIIVAICSAVIALGVGAFILLRKKM